MKKKRMIVVPLFLMLVAGPAGAVETTITVKVLSKGAKFIGSSMGGAHVILKDTLTGKILAQGVTVGGTGKTGRIMKEPGKPGMPLSDASAAKFTARIDIDDPTLVEVTARGPRSQLQAQNKATSTQWVVPGKHIDSGDAWLIELPGFAVDITAPSSATKFAGRPPKIAVQATVTMMCGCPLTPGGLWNADAFEITALVKKDGTSKAALSLAYAGDPSRFETVLPLHGPGVYEVCVYAYDPSNGNTGLDKVTFVVK